MTEAISNQYRGLKSTTVARHVVGGLFSGNFQTSQVFGLHAVAIFLMLSVAIYTVFSDVSLWVIGALGLLIFPFMLWIVGRMSFNLSRVFLYGKAYANHWTSYGKDYTAEQVKAANRLRRGYVFRYILCSSVIIMVHKIEPLLVAFLDAGMVPKFVLEYIALHIVYMMVIGVFVQMGPLLGAQAAGASYKAFLTKHPSKASDGLAAVGAGFWLAFLPAALSTFSEWLAATWLMELAMDNLFLAALSFAGLIAVELVFNTVLLTCAAVSGYIQRYPDARDFLLPVPDKEIVEDSCDSRGENGQEGTSSDAVAASSVV